MIRSVRRLRASFLVTTTVSSLALAWMTPAAAQSAATSSAQSSETGQQGADQNRETTSSSQDIVVTAQRRDERLSQVPISVQAATGQQLTAAGVVQAIDIPRIAPALSFTGGYAPESTSLSIRGVQSIGAEGGVQPSVAVVIDQVPLARQAEFVADLADIERVEILAGPQGTLFGKNSTAGVVNIITKRPTSKMETQFSIEATNDKEVVAKAALNVPFTSSVSARVNGYYHYIDPLGRNLGTSGDPLGLRAYGVQGKLLWDNGGPINFLVTGNYNKGSNSFGAIFVIQPNSGGLGTLQQIVNGPVFGLKNTTINQNTIALNDTKSHSITGELNWDLSDRLHLVSISGYRSYTAAFGVDADAGPTGYNPGRGYSPNPFGYPLSTVFTGGNRAHYKYFSQELRLSYTTSDLNMIGGAFYQNYDETRINDGPILLNGPPAFVTVNDIASALGDNTYAAFGDVTYEIIPKIKLFGGLRYTHEKLTLDYSNSFYYTPVAGAYDPETNTFSVPPLTTSVFTVSKSYDNISGRAGIQWQPTPELNYYFSYNRGYKGPAANQGRISIGASQALLLPEKANAFELGAKMRFMGGRAGLDLSLYHQTIYDLQQTSLIPGTILTAILNAGNLRTKGFQVDAFIVPSNGLTLKGSVVYNDATFRGNGADGNPVSFTCGPTPSPRCRADGTQSLVGQQGIGAPKWKVVTSVDYDRDVSDQLRLYARNAYNWRSSIQDQLIEDPLTRRPSAGFLDASLGVGGVDGSWRLTVFGNNLTNHFYYTNLNNADSFIGQQFGFIPRDFKRYGGLRLEVKM